MTAKSDDEFDPRFDPAFQRGFNGDRVRSVQPRPFVEQAPSLPASPAAPPIGMPPAASPADDAVVLSPSQIADAADEAEPQRRLNPFLVCLAVVSVALVAAGVWIIQITRAPFEDGSGGANADYVLLQLLGGLAPAAIALGIATAIGIVFVYAVDWQKRH